MKMYKVGAYRVKVLDKENKFGYIGLKLGYIGLKFWIKRLSWGIYG